jgi:Ser/Thr protein kinase RdoA (MazF antagonist)
MAQAYDEGDLPRLAEVARAAAARWQLDPRSAIDLLNLSENATYAIREPGAGTPVILRVGRPGYSTAAEIASELAWVDALRDRVRTAPVISAPGGERVVEVGGRPCVLFGFCPGSEPGEDGGHFERLGAVAARLHEHARGWTPPTGFTRRTWDERTTIGAAGHWGRWQDGMGVGADELALLGRLHDALVARLAGYGKDAQRFGLVHADMRLANLLVDGADTYVIDFDDCGFSWFLYDLAAAADADHAAAAARARLDRLARVHAARPSGGRAVHARDVRARRALPRGHPWLAALDTFGLKVLGLTQCSRSATTSRAAPRRSASSATR